MTPEEEVARALCKQDGLDPDGGAKLEIKRTWEYYVDDARAVIPIIRNAALEEAAKELTRHANIARELQEKGLPYSTQWFVDRDTAETYEEAAAVVEALRSREEGDG